MSLTDHDTAAELSAAATGIAAAISEGRVPSPADLDHARDMLDTLTALLGGVPPSSLPALARELSAALRANRRPAITDDNALDVQALVVAEEAGELVGAYRRWAGKARRAGTIADLEGEVADVLITTAIFAEMTGIDINAAIARKVAVIHTRGWREEDGTT